MDALQISTLVIAVVGAVLGLLNTWRTFSNDRVRLRVSTSWVLNTATGQDAISVEVVNLSTFPVTVDRLTFALGADGRHLYLPMTFLVPDQCLPVRLESRAGFTAFTAPSAAENEVYRQVTSVRVGTVCGVVVSSDRGLKAALHNFALARRQ